MSLLFIHICDILATMERPVKSRSILATPFANSVDRTAWGSVVGVQITYVDDGTSVRPVCAAKAGKPFCNFLELFTDKKQTLVTGIKPRKNIGLSNCHDCIVNRMRPQIPQRRDFK